ncbi:MAG: hypothetical protein EBU67_08220 [Actinobacteria bacterium]|nr:hypothetical protein [Actinomycetota bacterium]
MFESPRAQRVLAVAQFASTWFLVGLMWTIHFIHYALFPKVGAEDFVAFEKAHVDRIGNLLLLPWLTEGVTLLGILALAFLGSRRDLRLPALINSAAMGVVLVISGFWSAPAHGDLLKGFDQDVYDRLMTADLVRTFAWTVCGITAVWILVLLWPTNDGKDRA